MPTNARHAAVLWTGGKDSCLALHEAVDAGCPVKQLITFAPPQPKFLAHPLEVMRLQAEALRLPHRVLTVHEPHRESYIGHIRELREREGIDLLITGDIAEVCGSPNWIRECSEPAGMAVWMPLWRRERLSLLKLLFAREIESIFSCVKTRWLPPTWAGRALDASAVAELQALRMINGMDICGEEGEYHTLVTNSPRFRARIDLGEPTVREHDGFVHLAMGKVSLAAKTEGAWA